jgi:hypothetical protein
MHSIGSLAICGSNASNNGQIWDVELAQPLGAGSRLPGLLVVERLQVIGAQMIVL